MAACEAIAAAPASAHHHVGAPGARVAAEASTSTAATSQRTPAAGPIGWESWLTSAHPNPLAAPSRWMSPWPVSSTTTMNRGTFDMGDPSDSTLLRLPADT